ncbi:BlaR1 peptidase M56 [Kaistella treverensis]|uniref:BlaR1 peptidase M56 n=1 Tax=Kaistella treverensis TaxID=631455 RepID=A0A1I3K1Q2_9FLAO|nr:M56 family metallopeptidase [Kaistella treverensis]SFI66356.1 BlaR1 peptidase M56 [Kaistella treverensis]
MEILMYSGKVILTSGVLFFYYQLFLKDKTFHHYNRFYLLAAVVISMILPLLKVSYFTLEVNGDIYLILNNLNIAESSKNVNQNFDYFSLIAIFTGLIASFLIVKFLYGLAKIESLKKKFKKENFEGISFYHTNLPEAPFSFFKNLFWKDSIILQSDLGKQILKHEMVHIEQKHTWDKILLEVATSLFWFNPFFYFIKKEISLIHEYLADRKALKNSDTKAFAQMLLASHFSGKQLPATSPFLSSNLKKRLKMLKKSKTKFSYARRIAALPLLFLLAFFYLVNAKNKEIKTSNLEVEKLIYDLKSDTITPNNKEQKIEIEKSLENVQQKIAEKQLEIQPLQERLNEKSDEARKIEEHLHQKTQELQKLADKKDFDNPKFKALDLEINDLSSKIEEIYGKEDFKNIEKMLVQKFGDMDQLYAKVDAYYNSDDFKNKIKDAEIHAKKAEEYVNSKKFKKQIKEAQKNAEKAAKKFNSPEFKKQIANAEMKAKEAEKMVNSPEFKAKIAGAEKKAQEAVKNSQLKDGITFNYNTNATSTNENPNLNSNDEIDIYIDGKVSTKAEMEKIDPAKIESVNVFKKGFDGKKKGEIYVKLKN